MSILSHLIRRLNVGRLRLHTSKALNMVRVLLQHVLPSAAPDLPRGNAISLSASQKSLRQIATTRYTQGLENYVQAPALAPALFLVTRKSKSAVRKPLILQGLRTLEARCRVSRLLSATCELLARQSGVYPQPSRFGTDPNLHPRATPPYSRDRFPDRRPFQVILAPKPRSIFTCNKKAIYPTIAETHSSLPTLKKYSVTPHQSSGDMTDEARALPF